MRIVLLGAGNVATHLGCALYAAGHHIVQVYSRTAESARLLAERIESVPTNQIDNLVTDAEVYIVSLKDDVVADVIALLCRGREEALFVHTAGSLPMNIFDGKAKRYGVLYPMQTFSKNASLDFHAISCFIEASDTGLLAVLRRLAESVSAHVYDMSSADRKYLHLAAVFACNFVNHCFDLSAKILQPYGIPFSVMLPLIDETVRKVHAIAPHEAQTGPAARHDEKVIEMQSGLLSSNTLMQEIYDKMSHSIMLSSNIQEK
uniref:DUF2520 domain-containing protein n=1 Tax=Prevotella sp. GTC17259 TaxID=3236795 RepID=A0AB33J0S4_9BACT